MTTNKLSAITKGFSLIDITEGELHTLGLKLQDQYAKLAGIVLRRAKKDTTKLTIEKELDRLIKVAKDALTADNYEPKNVDPKNVWSGIKNTMRLRLAKKIAPDMVIKVKAGKDDKGNTVTADTPVKQLPENARGISENNAILKKALTPDSTDKRAKNGKKPAKRGAQHKTDSTAPQGHSSSTTAKDWSDAIAYMLKAGVKAEDNFWAGLKGHLSELQEKIGDRKGEVISINPKLKK